MYKVIRNFLFLFPPEAVHHFAMNMLKAICSIGFLHKIISVWFNPGNSNNNTTLFGLTFKNWVGLGAGFDKNALYLRELEALGFGFIEIGTVTPRPQPGNDQPRLFRLPKDNALINRMGFNNDGVKVIADRLHQWKNYQLSKKKENRVIIGGNIGKNKLTPNEEAWKDYEICFKALVDCVDYFVVNVSSPNTPGLRELQEKESLRKILSHLQIINKVQANAKPILLKIAPDLTEGQLNDVIDLAIEIKLDGLVVSNTTISRERLVTSASTIKNIGAGGLSGRPLKERSTHILQYIKDKTGGAIPLIGSGGVFTREDATEKINAGASLVQVWTGFIYEGPGIVKNISKNSGAV